jgi:hypothetical protein
MCLARIDLGNASLSILNRDVRIAMSAKSIGLVMAAVFIFASVRTAKADEKCDFPSFSYMFGSHVSTTMSVKQGSLCSSDLRADIGSNLKLKVTEKPKHGFAGTSGVTGWVYKAAKGYVGPDRFTLSLWNNGPLVGNVVTTITYEVSVHR